MDETLHDASNDEASYLNDGNIVIDEYVVCWDQNEIQIICIIELQKIIFNVD